MLLEHFLGYNCGKKNSVATCQAVSSPSVVRSSSW
jgi:hypothetical protein